LVKTSDGIIFVPIKGRATMLAFFTPALPWLRSNDRTLGSHAVSINRSISKNWHMQPLEIEVKFYLADAGIIRNRIMELGARRIGRAFETNIRFEDANQSLIRQKSILRLRKDAKTRLTFKSKPCLDDKEFKILKELEVEVSDFDTMKHILESIGFHKEQIYEKWRETFILNGTTLCIDTLPYGDFLEIEGEKHDIKTLSVGIGLEWDKRILTNYLQLFEIIRDKLDLPFSDVTFDNFKNIRIDFQQYEALA
jgi:adenylate cyclase class 2